MVARSNTSKKKRPKSRSGEIDPFTRKRIHHFIEMFREKTGQLPSLRDLTDNGFEKPLIQKAEKEKIIEMYYVTLTTGAVIKGYRARSNDDG